MNPSAKTPIDSLRQNLRQLAILRSVLLAFLACGLLASLWVDNNNLPYAQIIIILSVFSAIQLFTLFRLRHSLPVTNSELCLQLLTDVICLNLLFYFSGGATNPFVSYLLVPICISAATLPWRFTWAIAALCILGYSNLLFFYVSLPIFAVDHMHASSQLNGHVLGMWFNFFVSAILITYFVVKMARTLREQEVVLNELREDELRNEQVIAVATLAAGAAHEVNTPLATMAVLLGELRSEHHGNAPLSDDLNLLSQQVKHCAAILKQMVQDSSVATEGEYQQQNLKIYCETIVARWQLMRPEINLALQMSVEAMGQTLEHDSRLDRAILNLLHNAADASPTRVAIDISVEQNDLCWKILDVGGGISEDLAPMLGRETISSKEHGLGLGMLLSHATIKRYGGSLVQTANKPRGTITTVKLPLLHRLEK